MKLLYCSWNENSMEDTLDAIKELGLSVTTIIRDISEYTSGRAIPDIVNAIDKETDVVFSYDFLPVVSEVCNKKNVTYICWVYDWPNYTLYNPAVYNSCNRIYLFDRSGIRELLNYGINNIRYQELAVNTKRLDKLFTQKIEETRYEYEVSFVGNMYPDIGDIFPEKDVADYYMGYIEALMNAQSKVYGYNLINSVINRNFAKKYYEKNSNGYDGRTIPYEVLLSSQINKALTGKERRRIIEEISKRYKMDVFTGTKDINNDNAIIHKPVDYINEMPYIFRKSKINLNITLRSISSGVPLRVFDVLGAGGFCLTNYQEEIAEHFTDGKDLVMFESIEDMLEKIEYYLKNNEKRLQIAVNGHETVRKYNFIDAFGKMIDW